MRLCKWNLAREMSVVPSTATPHTVPTSIAENTAILGEMKYSLVSGMKAAHRENRVQIKVKFVNDFFIDRVKPSPSLLSAIRIITERFMS